jgi:hypothetical protein
MSNGFCFFIFGTNLAIEPADVAVPDVFRGQLGRNRYRSENRYRRGVRRQVTNWSDYSERLVMMIGADVRPCIK